MRFGVIVFPGSNCDADVFHVVDRVIEQPVEYVWHKNQDISEFDCLVLPGGFSYGDYLRAGAIARFAPVMERVKEFAQEGKLILGICNGFQILCEIGLLPGALHSNESTKFECKDVYVKTLNVETPFTNLIQQDQVLRIPIAHAEGNYYASGETLEKLRDNDQVVFRYTNEEGRATAEANPNGSVYNIAGICNERGNVLGMMPHPERCAEEILGNTDGRLIFDSILAAGKELVAK